MSRVSKTESILKPCPTDEELDYNEEDLKIVNKQSLLPKTGNALPIHERFVGLTQALFYEYRYATTCDIQAPYCLKPYDFTAHGVLYRSMYLIYMTCDSEYEAAITLLGSYPHWQKLKRAPWFKEHLATWNAEIGLREEALAKSKLIDLTEKGNVTAARTLLTSKKPPGRPPKAGKRKPDTEVNDDLDSMLARTTTTINTTLN